ncbi:hypothetical protein H9Y04_43905 [Streptomyces sp. TRM66268-LWL]|uniref:SpdC protein n=1 Tax=Streptomyces polyasparticus TaxID=2767826 RepID=A0ABR7SX58_9ACTN|nr:hypothetical protein [Streptomyces polyasparticus]MBC9719474.1 hypothetical protein [Streptomyces polyasparticus]
MDVPFWFFITVVAVIGVKLARPPLWLVLVLLIGGYLIAGSFLAPAIETGTESGVEITNP